MLDKRKFYINGKWVDPVEKNDFEVINPCNEDPCAIISLGSKKDTDNAVKAAKNAFKTWKEIKIIINEIEDIEFAIQIKKETLKLTKI